MKKTLTLIAVIALAQWAMGQTNVEIVGATANGAGKKIELLCYEDMLSQREIGLDSTVIDGKGAFRLGCYLTYPRMVILQVENYSQCFYAEPGRKYEVALDTFDWDLDERHNVFLDPVALPFLFLGVDSTEMNLQMLKFDRTVDSVVDRHRVFLDRRYRPNRRYMDTLEREAYRAVPDGDNTFLNRYKEYRLAEMRLNMGFFSRKALYTKYIEGRPINYHDESYMQFFFSLFAGMVSHGTTRIAGWRIEDWVRECGWETMMDSLGVEPLLRNEQVRELVVLQALKEAFYDNHYDRNGVRCMVHRLKESTKFAEHRRLAESLLATFERMEQGGEMPRLVLPDVEHQKVDLGNLNGKCLYIAFVRVGDPNCLKEIETMAHFHDTLKAAHPEVEMVCVECSREFQRMYHFLRNNKKGKRCNWTWLHFDGHYDLLSRLGVVSYPTFLLVNPEGRLIYDVTPAPASGIFLHGPWERKEKKGDGESE